MAAAKRSDRSTTNTRARKKLKVIPGTYDPTVAHTPKIRVVDRHEGERLTTDELRKRFARNLGLLIEIVGLSRKQAAEEIGISYALVRRLVSAGISRKDDRAETELHRITQYFSLEETDDLWHCHLLQLLLTSARGVNFVTKFRPQLLERRERLLEAASEPEYDPLELLNFALGFENAMPKVVTGPEQTKVAAILSSSKASQFRQLIRDYFELIEKRDEETGARRAANK